jgi:hypothetical protein
VLKIDWELTTEADGAQILIRYETPIWLWFLDRWLRVPDFVFDRIEYWFPRTSPITRVPCRFYSRWFPEYVMRRNSMESDLTPRPEPEYED